MVVGNIESWEESVSLGLERLSRRKAQTGRAEVHQRRAGGDSARVAGGDWRATCGASGQIRRAVDGDRDGYATGAELLEFYRYFGAGPIRVRHSSVSEASDWQRHGELWTRLDVNGDGLLALSELAGASKLALLDRDGNEVEEYSRWLEVEREVRR